MVIHPPFFVVFFAMDCESLTRHAEDALRQHSKIVNDVVILPAVDSSRENKSCLVAFVVADKRLNDDVGYETTKEGSKLSADYSSDHPSDELSHWSVNDAEAASLHDKVFFFVFALIFSKLQNVLLSAQDEFCNLFVSKYGPKYCKNKCFCGIENAQFVFLTANVLALYFVNA